MASTINDEKEKLITSANKQLSKGRYIRWIIDPKSKEYIPVYVIGKDTSNPIYQNGNNLIILKTDATYQRVNANDLKSTNEINDTVQSKLNKLLLFATERCNDYVTVPGSILTKQAEKEIEIKTKSTGILASCFGGSTTEIKKIKCVNGFKVLSYEWDESECTGFHTLLIGHDDKNKHQFISALNDLSVTNVKDPYQRKLRAKENELKQKNEKIKSLQQELDELKQANDNLQDKSNKQRRNSVIKINDLNTAIQENKTTNDKLTTKLSNSYQLNESLKTKFKKERDELRAACNNAIIEKEKVENEKNILFHKNNQQIEEIKQLTSENEELKELRNKLQDRLFELNPDVVSLDSNFPTVQDIVMKFDVVRSQIHSNCKKSIKKYFKSVNSDHHKLMINKKTNILLYKLLINCYKKMIKYLDIVYNDYKLSMNINDDKKLKTIAYSKLKKEFEDLFNKVNNDYITNILNEINAKYKTLFEFCAKDLLQEYIKESLYSCWCIVIYQSPQLKLYPIDDDINNDDNKQDDNDDDIEFDENKHEVIYGSEESESLNYYSWPSIMRTDNNHQLSKMYALFLDELPEFSTKALKRMKQQST